MLAFSLVPQGTCQNSLVPRLSLASVSGSLCSRFFRGESLGTKLMSKGYFTDSKLIFGQIFYGQTHSISASRAHCHGYCRPCHHGGPNHTLNFSTELHSVMTSHLNPFSLIPVLCIIVKQFCFTFTSQPVNSNILLPNTLHFQDS